MIRHQLLLATAICVTATSATAQGEPAVTFDGEPQSLVVVGYSTSYAWPTMLQQMLDEHTGGRRVYHVLNAVAGGAAVERWIDEPGSRHYERTMGAMKRDFFGKKPKLRGDAPPATIALCQQSLQFTRTQRGPIARTDDLEGIRIGADAMEKLSRQLHDLGIERVYWGMHIYKKPIEPEVGNERLALAALLRRKLPFVFEGPDVWQPTKDGFPDCFDEDGVHPSALGMKIMAEHWYRTLVGPAARGDIIERMHARNYDVRPMMRNYMDWRAGKAEAPVVRIAESAKKNGP